MTRLHGVLRAMAGVCLCAMLAAPGAFAAKPAGEPANVSHLPAITMKVWKESTESERFSFLLGFFTMVDLEKEWQGEKPLPANKSLVPCWVKGLQDVPLQQVRIDLDAYAVAHPEKADQSVIEVLWLTYVQPKLTEETRREVRATYQHNKELQKR